jgi:hypothetical protein
MQKNEMMLPAGLDPWAGHVKGAVPRPIAPDFILILNSAFASRPGQFIKDFLADRFADFFPGLGFAGDGRAWHSASRQPPR